MTECSFVTGPAGTGKTHKFKTAVEAGERITLAATTGIAAVNLGPEVTTINSLLGYFDTASLAKNWENGKLVRAMADLDGTHLVIDEASMMSAPQVDMIVEAADRVKQRGDSEGVKLTLVGDFCQLPPVNEPFAFFARHWNRFQENTEKLTKIWRQVDPGFQRLLQVMRAGEDESVIGVGREVGVEFSPVIDENYHGTTIVATNDMVDKINRYHHTKLEGEGREAFSIRAFRWGQQKSEWRVIPFTLDLVDGAKVMLLANIRTAEGGFYANGQIGEVAIGGTPQRPVAVMVIDGALGEVRLAVQRVTRKNFSSHTPLGMKDPETPERLPGEDEERYRLGLESLTRGHQAKAIRDRPDNPVYYDFSARRWVVGEVTYCPLRLAYAITVHKSQGLQFDEVVQIDLSHRMMEYPAMAYVAVSRAKSLEGLRLIGDEARLRACCNNDIAVRNWV